MTSYTAQIENGNITTGKDFLKLCTRMHLVKKTLEKHTNNGRKT